MQWVPLSPSQHADALYLPRQRYRHTRDMTTAAVMVGEMHKIVPHYAMAFMQYQGDYRPVVLLGGGPLGNVYLRPNHLWQVNYVPASLRAYPFAMMSSGDQVYLSLDQDHLSDFKRGGSPLFDARGNLTRPVKQTLQFLESFRHQQSITEKAAQALQAAEVIKPWDLTLTLSQQKITLNGLYCIDEERLNQLDAATLNTLKGAPLALAYGQLFSMGQADTLNTLAQSKLDQTETAQAPIDTEHDEEVDLDTLFGGDDDMFRF